MKCKFCGSLSYEFEKNHCCHHGTVNLPDINFPDSLKNIFLHNNQFKQNIRIYNNALSFASFSCKPVEFKSRGPPVLKLHGRVYRRISNLHPDEGEQRKFGQFFILDARTAAKERMQDKVVEEHCDEITLRRLHQILQQCHNPFVAAYKMMHELEEEMQDEQEHPNLIMYFIDHGAKQMKKYCAPVNQNEVAAVFINEKGEAIPPQKQNLYITNKHGASL